MSNPTITDANRFWHRCSQVLTEVTMNGFKINRDYFMEQKPIIAAELHKTQDQLFSNTEIGKLWYKRFADRTNVNSNDQLKLVLQKDVGFTKFGKTEKGADSIDKDVISKLPIEFSSKYLKYKQLDKCWSGTIVPIMMGADENGLIHANFGLHTVRTYRTSCTSPNLQNVSKKNPMLKSIIRKGFVPRSADRMLIEIDLAAAEVAVGCCLHQDPQMLEFLRNSEISMHDFAARKLFITDDYSKETRNETKGIFTFAISYGAGSESIAYSYWEYVDESGAKLKDGTDLKQHLAGHGITDLESATAHVKKVYDWYQNELFKVSTEWKRQVWEAYKVESYIDLPTGFRATAKMIKTQTDNIATQGATCHLLLATLCGLHDRIKAGGLRSVIVSQVHDSIVLDVLPEELTTVCNLYLDSQNEVRKNWEWLLFPINADADKSSVGGTWCDMVSMGGLIYDKQYI